MAGKRRKQANQADTETMMYPTPEEKDTLQSCVDSKINSLVETKGMVPDDPDTVAEAYKMCRGRDAKAVGVEGDAEEKAILLHVQKSRLPFVSVIVTPAGVQDVFFSTSKDFVKAKKYFGFTSKMKSLNESSGTEGGYSVEDESMAKKRKGKKRKEEDQEAVEKEVDEEDTEEKDDDFDEEEFDEAVEEETPEEEETGDEEVAEEELAEDAEDFEDEVVEEDLTDEELNGEGEEDVDLPPEETNDIGEEEEVTKADPATAPGGARELANIIRHLEDAMEYLEGNTPSHEPEYGESTHAMIKDMVGESLGKLQEEAAGRYPSHDMKAIAEHEGQAYQEKEEGAGETPAEYDEDFEGDEDFEFDENADAVTDEILDRYKNPKGIKRLFLRLKSAANYMKGLAKSKSAKLAGKDRGRLNYHAKALGDLFEGIAGPKQKAVDADGNKITVGCSVKVQGSGSGEVVEILKSGVSKVKLKSGHHTWVKGTALKVTGGNGKMSKEDKEALLRLQKSFDRVFGNE